MNLHRWKTRFFALLFSRFPALTTRWLKRQQLDDYGPPPWTSLREPLSACTVALVTTAGVHRQNDEPYLWRRPGPWEGSEALRVKREKLGA